MKWPLTVARYLNCSSYATEPKKCKITNKGLNLMSLLIGKQIKTRLLTCFQESFAHTKSQTFLPAAG